MRDKLVIEEDRYGFRIQWWLAEQQDMGAVLGEEVIKKVGAEPGSEDWENETANVAVLGTTGQMRDSTGFYWESRRLAQAALKAAKAAIKNRPLADWEKKALEHGWKPPKGRL